MRTQRMQELRTASRKGPTIRGPASSAAQRSRPETNPHTRLPSHGGCPCSKLGSGGRWQWVPCSSPTSLVGPPRLIPAHYIRTSSHGALEKMVSTHENSPTPSFVWCSLACNALRLSWGVYLDFPHPEGLGGGGSHPPPYTVRRLPDQPTRHLPTFRATILRCAPCAEFLVGFDDVRELHSALWCL